MSILPAVMLACVTSITNIGQNVHVFVFMCVHACAVHVTNKHTHIVKLLLYTCPSIDNCVCVSYNLACTHYNIQYVHVLYVYIIKYVCVRLLSNQTPTLKGRYMDTELF